MSFLNNLEKLLGVAHQAPAQQSQSHTAQAAPNQLQAHQAQAQPQAEDNALVNTPHGQMPLSSVPAGGQWSRLPGPAQYPQLHVSPQQGYGGNVGQGNQFVNAQQSPQLNQGGQFNPGYTPLQSSNNALPQPNLMAPQYPQGPNLNPQRSINLY